ncbi:MAG: AbrB/MazE/SpoVT family DNA-binding domain-containing protein [Halodesulfurarchaeum sp.]
MSDDDSTPSMFPSAFAETLQQAGVSAEEMREQMTRTMLKESDTAEDFPLDAVQETATFKTRVQSSGRISIPDAEREILEIGEGDIVQAVIVPLKRSQSDD